MIYRVVLCLESKEFNVTIHGNTVKDLTSEVARWLKQKGIKVAFKTLETVNASLILDYFLSLPDSNLDQLLYKNIKLRPYFGTQG